MSLYRRRDQRWLSVYNSTQETIPAFAAMQIMGTDTVRNQGQMVVTVGKPDANNEVDQDPNWLLFNSEIPIKAGDYGVGTQDYPAQALIGYAPSAIAASQPFSAPQPVVLGITLTHFGKTAGPAAGKWNLELGRTAFTTIGLRVDPSSTTNFLGVGIVQAHTANFFFRFAGNTFDATLAPQESVPLSAQPYGQLDWVLDPRITTASDSTSVAESIGPLPYLQPAPKGGWIFQFAGLYQFGFSCTLTNPDQSSANDLLALVVNVNGISTFFSCGRTNAIGLVLPSKAATPNVENVSLTGILWLSPGDEVEIINGGVDAVTVSMFNYWFLRLAGS